MKHNNKRIARPSIQSVPIEFNHATATSVGIAGTSNDWKPEATPMVPLGDGRWHNDLALAPGVYESVEKILVRGIHLEITPALRAAALRKGARLLRHQARLVRVRIEIEYTTDARAQFVAKGHIEIGGPDLVASVASEDAYKSLDLLVNKLDRMLRERSRIRADQRNNRPEGTEFRDRLAQPSEAASPVLVEG
jgi:putative sigma-54 modulation protein